MSKKITKKEKPTIEKVDNISFTYKDFDSEIKQCKCCFGDMDKDVYAFYQENKDEDWYSSNYCKDCITQMLGNGWNIYVEQIKKADCKAALLKLIERGPPINLRDKLAFPCENPQCEVYAFYFDDKVQSAKLKDSFTGKKRKEWWDELKEIALAMKDESKETKPVKKV